MSIPQIMFNVVYIWVLLLELREQMWIFWVLTHVCLIEFLFEKEPLTFRLLHVQVILCLLKPLALCSPTVLRTWTQTSKALSCCWSSLATDYSKTVMNPAILGIRLDECYSHSWFSHMGQQWISCSAKAAHFTTKHVYVPNVVWPVNKFISLFTYCIKNNSNYSSSKDTSNFEKTR